MNTKKTKKANRAILYALLFILLVTLVINTAQSALTPKILTFENQPMSWDVRKEAESAEAKPEHKDEVKDGVVATGGIEEKIAQVFPENSRLISAVFKAESGHNPTSMNWNCRYKNDQGEMYSKACKPEDRGKAWSVDCGIAQINTLGQTCPEELFDPEHNLTVAKKMYDARGLNPWMAYLNQSYKKFL
jgi:hypothetical protein